MLTKVIFMATVLYAQSVYSNHYHGPTALPEVLHNGYLADTHEVAAAKSAHLATLSHQSHGGSYGHQGDSHYNQHGHQEDLRYHGPIAIPHVLHDGHIADTHEVAAAKARAHGGYNHGGDYSGQRSLGYDHNSGAPGAHSSYQGPIAIPHVLHNGHIADTHEVAAAKAEHFAAVAKARAHGGYNHGGDYSGQHSSGYDHYYGAPGAHNSYQGPIAIPHVLHDGHIADTHEVAAAKAEHFAAVAKARAHGGYNHGGDYSGQHATGYSSTSETYHGYGNHGATAKPVVLSSGYLADTHEVSHAKQHHLQALHEARNHSDNTHLYH